MGWSNKYKGSINCSNPKGFSQKAHCQSKKKRNERIMKLSELKEEIKNVIRERSINAISKLQQKNLDNISKALEFYKKNKHTDKKEPFIKLLKKLGKEKEALAKELDMKVSGMYKNAEYKGESVNEVTDKKSLELIHIGLGKPNSMPNPVNVYKKWKSVQKKHKLSDKALGDYLTTYFKKEYEIARKFYMSESLNEGPSTEEKRIAMLAVRKQAKYRSVSLEQAIQDQINALEELKRDAKRGKLK